MSFFNKKEEVIDIQLTRYGKVLLSEGNFKPAYYQFFDDDIIYSQKSPNYTSELQNEVQDRILENTPRFKSAPRVFSRADYRSEEFSLNFETETHGHFYSLEEQDRILLYPLSTYENGSPQAPYFELKSYDCEFIENHTKFLHFTGSGIYKKIPQLKIDSTYQITRTSGLEVTEEELRRAGNSNNFIDLTGDSIQFLDKSRIDITGDKIVLSLEEANTYYNVSNFELEIYEVDESVRDDDESVLKGPALKRIKNIDDISKLFHIKTDEDVSIAGIRFGRENNWYRTGE